MSHPKPVAIHLGKCLGDLQEYYKIPDLKNKKVNALCASAKTMLEEAKRYRIDGDEELAYIFFMKYMNIIHVIKAAPEYLQRKKYFNEVLGWGRTVFGVMDTLEQLAVHLTERYEKIAAVERNGPTSLQVTSYERDLNKYKNQNDNVGPLITTERISVSCHELYKMMGDSTTSMLIMDCRTINDFEKSKIKYQYILNVPEEYLHAGNSAGRMQQKLPDESKRLWACRGIKDYIVLMDWSSRGPNLSWRSSIYNLQEILTSYDPDVKYKNPILMLEQGYDSFSLHYPAHCINPQYRPAHIISGEPDTLGDIEYPNISDILMKDDSNTFSSTKDSKPGIDRKSKEHAIRTYEQKRPNISEILEEQEKIMDKSLKYEKQLIEAEEKKQSIQIQQEKEDTEEEKSKLQAYQVEVDYNLLQLENSKRDLELENEKLRKELEEYKKKETEEGNKITEREASLLEDEAAKRIKEKEEAYKKLEEEREHKKKLLEFAREQKRHMKQNDDDEGMSKPKIPQIDRTVKPSVKPLPVFEDYNQNEYMERDFSPVFGNVGRGLTGLKNLGNTCYMNSILQCLSNTPYLTQYFLDGEYKQHVNKENKTQGKIVEEVAALTKVLWTGQYKCVASRNLRYVVGKFESTFGGIEQQDSHEFLTFLVDWLHSDLQTLTRAVASIDSLPASEKAWLEFTKSKESQISRLFYGQIKSTIKCTECEGESATYESFSNLSLELPPSHSRCDLDNCLDMYFRGEKIRGWNCPRCKTKQIAIKKLDISKLPSVMVIHLKRFYADPDAISSIFKKKQNYVTFPLNNMDMEKYVARSEINRNKAMLKDNYRLYGVSNHYGSMESGHYTAFCRSSVHQKWYKFDDHTVSSLDSSDVLSSAAYILFYTCLPEQQPADHR